MRHDVPVTTPWLPEDWAHPERVELPLPSAAAGGTAYHLRPITADDTEKDVAAVMGSQERLWSIYGEAWGWPPADMSAEADREDLQRHWEEVQRHESFNYALLDAAETELVGCVYVDPPDRDDCDAVISWWVRDEHVGTEVEAALDAFVPAWVERDWPLSRPFYGVR